MVSHIGIWTKIILSKHITMSYCTVGIIGFRKFLSNCPSNLKANSTLSLVHEIKMSLSVELLPGSLYANNAYNGGVEIISFLFCMILSERLGRRFMTGGLLFISGVLCILSSLTQYLDTWLFMGKIFAIAAKSCVAGSFTMIYIFASELYPTEIRSIGKCSEVSC